MPFWLLSSITLLYKMDTQDLLSTMRSTFSSGCVHYRLSVDTADWIVSGRLEGTVLPKQQMEERSQNGNYGFDLEFLAIPVRPGVIEQYPSLSLFLQSSKNGSTATLDSVSVAAALTPLEAVKVVAPGPFDSLPPTIHTTVAVPIQIAKQNRGSFAL